MADKAAEEAKAIGVNWTFAPITDVVYNWRNTIVNNRAFGNDPDEVIADSIAYMEGAHKHGLACCCKHFPGDGVEKSFGKVYRAVFEAGVESVMVGHICMPAWSKKLRPGMTDDDILPATLSPELLQDLLRDRLGFNGLARTRRPLSSLPRSRTPRCPVSAP